MFLYKNCGVLIPVSLKFVADCPIDKNGTKHVLNGYAILKYVYKSMSLNPGDQEFYIIYYEVIVIFNGGTELI